MTDSNTVAPVSNDAPQYLGMPRGPLIVVAIGLIASLAAAVLATDKSGGSAADVEWVQERPLPDSRTVTVPGGGGTMRLTENGLRATGTNVSGYELYRVASVLSIDAGAPVGSGRILCSVRAPGGTEVAQTPDLRAIYPRSSDELYKQDVPEVSLLRFSSQGAELAVVEMGDLFEGGFAGEPGIKLEWPTYEVGVERWEWFLPPGPPAGQLKLPFASIWKTTHVPSARIACTLTTSAGTATARTHGALPGRSEPIDEEEDEDE